MRTRWLVLSLVVAAAAITGAVARESGPDLEKARIAMADRDYATAVRLLTEIIDQGAPAEEARVLRMRARLGLGDPEAVLTEARDFFSFCEGSPYTGKVRYLMADAYVRLRGFSDAARIYRERVEFLTGDGHLRKVAGYYLDLARRAYEGEEQRDEFDRPKVVKDFRRAKEYYELARSIALSEEDEAMVAHRIAVCRLELGDLGGAVAEWRKLLEDRPDSKPIPDALYRLGETLDRQGKVVEARQALGQLLERFPDSPRAAEALIVLGRTYRPADPGTGSEKDEERVAAGIARWNEFLKLHPSHAGAEEISFKIGDAWARSGKHKEAIAAFRDFLAAHPDGEFSPKAKYRIALSQLALHDFDGAVATFREFLSRWPNHELWTDVQNRIPLAELAKGLVPFRQAEKAPKADRPGYAAKAEAGFEAFVAAYPAHKEAAAAQFRIALLRSWQDDYSGAVKLWRNVAAKYAGEKVASAALWFAARTTSEKLGDLPAAIELYEELVARYPGSDEGSAARGLLAELKKKRLTVSSERVYRTDEALAVKLSTRNIERLTLKAYPFDARETFRRKLRLGGVEDVDVTIVDPAFTAKIETPEYEKYRTFERSVEVPVPEKLRGPGAWILVLEEEDLTATVLAVVTDITIVTKQAPGQTLVFAVDQRTGRPASGVDVLAAAGGKVRAEGRTGEDGVLVLENEELEGNVSVFADRGGHVAATGLRAPDGPAFGYSTKVFLTTDRPLYRPGQDVNLKGLLRRVENGEYRVVPGEKVHLRVTDSKGTVVYDEELAGNDEGSFSSEIGLLPTAALGTWKIQADTLDEKTFLATFEVREFKKPEFTITARTDRRTYFPGEQVKLDLSLRYTFGGPVPGTVVRYRIARMPFQFDPSSYDEYAWFTKDPERERERERRNALGARPVSAGEIRTDSAGDAKFELRLEDRDEDQRYFVSFEALDLNRQWVRETAAVTVTRRGYFVIAKTEKQVYRPGEEIPVRLTAVDALSFPVEAEGFLAVNRQVPGATDEPSVVGEAEVSRSPVRFGEDGKATVKCRVRSPGSYVLRYVGEDRRGNRVVGRAFVTIAGESEDLSRHARVLADRQIYKEGESAKLLVNSPVAPVTALLTFEGERVIEHRVVRLEEKSTTLTLPLTAAHAPNVFIRVAIPGREKLYEDGDEVFVLKYLDVSVEPDRDEAGPGEEVSLKIRTLDQGGHPVQAEVGVSVFDRAILALEPDGTPQIRPYFYDQRRRHRVSTASSLSFKYGGTTRETNRDVQRELLRREGREAFIRTMKYVQAGKELLDRGDLEGAAIELAKALSISPGNYEARTLLARTRVARDVQRQEEKRSYPKSANRITSEPAERAAGWAGSPAPQPSPSGRPAAKPGAPADGEVGKLLDSIHASREHLDYDADKSNQSEMLKKVAAGRFFDRGNDGDYRGRAENLFDVSIAQAAMIGDPMIPAGVAVPAELRKNFADTAAWEPHVLTGPDGTAVVTVTLPDNLTTWRAAVRGATKSTLVGEAFCEIVSKKDLLVRLDTPRFLTQGDRVTATATVHNQLGHAVQVALGVEGENVDVMDPAEFTAALRSGEIRVEDVGLFASGHGLARLTATALSTEVSDAVETGLPVLPYGLPRVIGRSGAVTEEAALTFEIPENVVPGTKTCVLSLSPGMHASLLESLVYLGGYPYGCLEQTVNRFLPAIAADRALKSIGSADENLSKRISAAVERGLLALYSFQNPDGSFGWFSGDLLRPAAGTDRRAPRVDPMMTALAILSMEWARQAGYRVSEPHRVRAVHAGRKLVKATSDPAARCMLLLSLASAGAAELEDLNRAYRYRDGLGSQALATLALAMQRTKRPYNSVALVRLLKSRAIREGAEAHWAAEGRHGVMNEVETTAWALRALLRVEPESDLADAAARWLMSHRRGAGWASTRDTGAAVMAMGDYLRVKGVERSDYVTEIWLNDGEVPYQRVRVSGGEIAADNARTVIVDGARLRTGENRIRIVKKGPGDLFYTFRVGLVSAEDKLEPGGNLLAVERRYAEYVSPLAAKEGREEIRPGWTIVRPDARPEEDPGATIERAGSGDKFRIRLTVTAREKLPYVMVSDPLPAGVEVIEGLATGPFDRVERRDERQVFFLSELPEGRTELSYVVQAVHPGVFRALPARAEPMYEPTVFGRSGENRLTVLAESGVVGRPTDPEGATPDEIFALGRKAYGEKRYEQARGALEAALGFPLLDEYAEQCHAMLMRIGFALNTPRKAVLNYERLVELDPHRGPKDREERKSLAVAYQEIGENERALALLKDVVDEQFGLEAKVAETYRAIGQTAHAQEFLVRLLKESPDSNVVVDAAYRTALRYLEMKVPKAQQETRESPGVETGLLLPEGLAALHGVMANYPESPYAARAARMAVTVLNRMELWDEAIEEARRFIVRYPKSADLDDVQWYVAESCFRRDDFEGAFEAGRVILESKFPKESGSAELVESPFVPHVKYLFAKIHHLKGELAEAVKLYESVAKQFEDARDAYRFLTEEALDLPESAVFKVGERPRLKLRRKNLEDLELRIYPVDLMLLVAVKKDLNKAADVDLTGIAPTARLDRKFADGRDYRWHEEQLDLGLSKKGAYLVLARSGDMVRSSIVLVSDLSISVQTVRGRVRVYATNSKTRQPEGGVFVTVGDGKKIHAQGFTDARGVFDCPAVRGRVQVVAEKDGNGALHR